MKVKGSVIFEVPINAAEVLIQYETNFISGKKLTFMSLSSSFDVRV